MTEQGQINERVDHFIVDQEEFNEPVDPWFDRIDGRLDRIDGRLDRMDGWFDRMEGWFDRMEGHLTYSKNRSSKIQASREPATIAMVMGFTVVRVLSNADLARMCRVPTLEISRWKS